MRFNILLIVLALSSVTHTAFSQGFSGDSWAKAKQSKTANIAVTYSDTPMFAQVINGKPSGLCFDIMGDFKAFVKNKYNVDLSINHKKIKDPKNFDLFLHVVKQSSGGVFGLGDITITESRRVIYNFSPSYFANVAILITSKSSPTLSSMDNITKDFAGMTAVTQKGNTHDKRIQKIRKNHGTLNVEYVGNSDQKLEKVLSSPKYFTYVDFPNYLNIMGKRMPLKRHVVGDDHGESFGFIMPKNSDWSSVLKEFFAANGGYTKTTNYRKHLSDNMGMNVLKMLDSFAIQ